MYKILFISILIAFSFSCTSGSNDKGNFVSVENGHFVKHGKPYYYIGANYWYGPILGAKGTYGDRRRLLKELDILKENGVDNLRILAGAEGPDGEPHRVTPGLQKSPGVYNDDLLEGLDFLLSEMKKRNMVAILYLNNSWEWSGGYAQYLNWNGYGNIPYPMVDGHTWPEFMNFSAQFHKCAQCKEQFYNHVRFMLNRINSINGKAYKDDPTIMAWEIGNEPRAFSQENKPLLLQLVNETSALIKSIAPNQLVTTGTEGKWGCEGDIELFKSIHSSVNVDYLTMHIWPLNWQWLDIKNMNGTVDKCVELAGKYMDEHIAIANQLNKPIVFEEFGMPRDGFSFDLSSPTTARDKYYSSAFNKVYENAINKGKLAGANFWTFGGIGKPNASNANHFWKQGDDLIGDPPQEEQGLNSVFINDSTMKIISSFNKKIKDL
jgi:mannan endo-1,4-beta-mannosidase